MVGQVSRSVREREAFQEIDILATFGPIAKWAAEVLDADRIPEFLSRAFATATGGRPGPVVLGLPEDVLRDQTSSTVLAPFERAEYVPAASIFEHIRALLAAAERPLILAGGAGWTDEASRALARFAETNHVAVATIFRYQDAFDNDLATYVGDVGMGVNPALASRLDEADLVMAIGAAPRGHHDRHLPALRRAQAASDTHSRAPGCRGDRPRLSADTRRDGEHPRVR